MCGLFNRSIESSALLFESFPRALAAFALLSVVQTAGSPLAYAQQLGTSNDQPSDVQYTTTLDGDTPDGDEELDVIEAPQVGPPISSDAASSAPSAPR